MNHLQLDDCSSYCLMQKIDEVMAESSFTFGVFETFVNNFRIFCPNKPEPYLHCPAVSNFEGWVQASLFNITKRFLIDMGVNLFVFSLAELSCDIMNKMFAFIEPEVPNFENENGKFTTATTLSTSLFVQSIMEVMLMISVACASVS